MYTTKMYKPYCQRVEKDWENVAKRKKKYEQEIQSPGLEWRATGLRKRNE